MIFRPMDKTNKTERLQAFRADSPYKLFLVSID